MNQKLAQVYGIESEGKILYVGVTTMDIRRRMSNHYDCAFKGRRGAKKLGQWLLNKPVFSVKILEYCPFETRFETEKKWINHYDTINNGLNSEHFVDAPGRPKGCKNPSGKDHYLYGKPACSKAIAASVAARKGKPLSEAHKQAQREGHLRRKLLKENTL